MTGPKQARTGNWGSRFYEWPPNSDEPEKFDSVTTILSGGVPKPALQPWGQKLVAETAFDQLDTWSKMSRDEAVDYLKRAPYRNTDKAAAQGSDVHAWAESYVLGHAINVAAMPLLQRPYAQGFLDWLRDFSPIFEMTEASVFNRTFGYAGTLDFIVTIDGAKVLGDIKTGKGVYGEVGLQLAAYRHAEFIGLPDGTEAPMPAVESCAVLHLTPTGYHFLPIEAGEQEFRLFGHAQQVKYFADVVSKKVIGSEMRPVVTA